MHIFIYTRGQNKLQNVFTYKKPDTLQKTQTICVTFLYKKSQSLYVTQFFMKILKLYFYTKSTTLCVRWRFYIQKYRHLAKSKTICVTFFYTKSLTLWSYAIFHWIFEIGGVGWGAVLYAKKQCALRYIFISIKKCTFALHFYIQKFRHFAVHFYMQTINK